MKKKVSIDWAKWQAIPEITLPSLQLWQACAMSLNIPPDTMEFSNDAWMSDADDEGPIITAESFPNDKTKKAFHDRLKILLSNLSNRRLFTPDILSLEQTYLHRVRIDEFAAFALRCNWAIPKQMCKLAKPPTTQTVPEPQVTGTTAPVGANKDALIDQKPWLLIDPTDPTPKQPWYTPARYFARQLTVEKPTLLSSRELLADKVSTSLFNAGFKKRGDKLRFDSGTVLKAFANVTLG